MNHQVAVSDHARTSGPLVSLCDARLDLKLPVEDRFPTIWMPSIEQRDLRSLLRPISVGEMRSRSQHTLTAIALNQVPRARLTRADVVRDGEITVFRQFAGA